MNTNTVSIWRIAKAALIGVAAIVNVLVAVREHDPAFPLVFVWAAVNLPQVRVIVLQKSLQLWHELVRISGWAQSNCLKASRCSASAGASSSNVIMSLLSLSKSSQSATSLAH